MGKLGTLIKYGAIGLAVAAVAKELSKPPEERTWHGTVAGFVPYDFRVPTMERLREAYWNPDAPQILTDRVLGIGWAINFGRLYKLALECYSTRCGPSEE